MSDPLEAKAVGQHILEGMRDFTDRLQIAGGHIEAIGLRMTTAKRCDVCYGDGEVEEGGTIVNGEFIANCCECPVCNGNGCIRTVTDGTGEGN